MPQTILYGHKNVKVTFQPNIGLDASVRQSVIDMLNLLLADETVLSFKTHKAAGNTEGTEAPELISLYNAQYKQINTISNEIVERVQIMGGTHLLGFKKLIEHARFHRLADVCVELDDFFARDGSHGQRPRHGLDPPLGLDPGRVLNRLRRQRCPPDSSPVAAADTSSSLRTQQPPCTTQQPGDRTFVQWSWQQP